MNVPHITMPLGYELLCRMLLKLSPGTGGWSTMLMAWPFFVLMWNLMSRPDSVECVHLQFIMWKEDCICIDENGVSVLELDKYVYRKCSMSYLLYNTYD